MREQCRYTNNQSNVLLKGSYFSVHLFHHEVLVVFIYIHHCPLWQDLPIIVMVGMIDAVKGIDRIRIFFDDCAPVTMPHSQVVSLKHLYSQNSRTSSRESPVRIAFVGHTKMLTFTPFAMDYSIWCRYSFSSVSV